MHMNVGTYIHAKLFNSTTAAAELAIQNPQKYFDFASQLITAKNTSNEKALIKASFAFDEARLSRNDLRELIDICHGSRGATPAATKGATQLLGAYMTYKSAMEEVTGLQHKKDKYSSLSISLIKSVDQFLAAKASKISP